MPSPLSLDLRERVVAAIDAGGSYHGVAARFGVSVSSASRWSARYRQEGQVAAKPRGGDQRSQAVEAQAERIVTIYEARPEIFLHELRDALAQHGVATSTSGLSRFFRRHRITRKKGLCTPPSRSGRT